MQVFFVALVISGILLSPLTLWLLDVISDTPEPTPLWAGLGIGTLWSYFCIQIARGRNPQLDSQLFRKVFGMERNGPAGGRLHRMAVFAVAGLLIGALLMWLAWESARRVMGEIYHTPIAEIVVLFPDGGS